jgi:hypothetical protein
LQEAGHWCHALVVISMDLIKHFWDLTTVSDANNKSYQIWYIPRVIISRISFSKRCSLQYVIKLSMPRVDTLGTVMEIWNLTLRQRNKRKGDSLLFNICFIWYKYSKIHVIINLSYKIDKLSHSDKTGFGVMPLKEKNVQNQFQSPRKNCK